MWSYSPDFMIGHPNAQGSGHVRTCRPLENPADIYNKWN